MPTGAALIRFFVDQKVLPAVVPVDHVITNQFINDINAYDRAALIEAAKADGQNTVN